MPVVCHCLIGPPGSGKTTVALQLASLNPNFVIVSPDNLKERLYGDMHHQGSWQEIEAAVLQEIHNTIAQGRSVIYDATNVRRAWRLNIMGKVPHAPSAYWIGWKMPTQREQCLAWNLDRERVVPEKVVYEMWDAFDDKNREPSEAEGFDYVATTPWKARQWQVESMLIPIAEIERSIINRRNKNSHLKNHRYVRLLDFERLLFIIVALAAYPGLGNLHKQGNSPLNEVVGDAPEFSTSELEIATVLKRQQGEVYSDPEAIAADLRFLDAIGLTNANKRSESIATVLCSETIAPSHIQGHYATHRYSDLDAMTRILAILRIIAYYPFTQDENTNIQEMLTEALKDQEIYTSPDTIRKDVQLILRPYGLLTIHIRSFKKGYFLGTGILNIDELQSLYGQIRQHKLLTLPNDSNTIFSRFQDRLEYSRILSPETLKNTYEIRRIGNRDIVDPKLLKTLTSQVKDEQLVQAILGRYPLRIHRLKHSARFSDGEESNF